MEKRHLLVYHILCHLIGINTVSRSEQLSHGLLAFVLVHVSDAFEEPRVDQIEEPVERES